MTTKESPNLTLYPKGWYQCHVDFRYMPIYHTIAWTVALFNPENCESTYGHGTSFQEAQLAAIKNANEYNEVKGNESNLG